jgi:sugar lactone lactonase YvrE
MHPIIYRHTTDKKTRKAYSFDQGISDTAPQIASATYRFRPSTGAVSVIDDSLQYPNGIALSPSGRTLYISDTGAGSGPIDGRLPASARKLTYNTTGARTVYAYDISADGTYATNKRPFYRSQDYVPDGLKVARNGYVLTATGHGVDILDEQGTLLVRIQTSYIAVNFQWTGDDLETLWIVGIGAISRVEWGLKGQILV